MNASQPLHPSFKGDLLDFIVELTVLKVEALVLSSVNQSVCHNTLALQMTDHRQTCYDNSRTLYLAIS